MFNENSLKESIIVSDDINKFILFDRKIKL